MCPAECRAELVFRTSKLFWPRGRQGMRPTSGRWAASTMGPGRGPSPAFVRAYNSRSTCVGSMGPGWMHGFEIRLRSPGDETEDLFLVRETGQADRYTHNEDGTYSPPPSVQATLVQDERA